MKSAPGERPETVPERPGSERVTALRREEEPSPPSRSSPQDRQTSVQTSQVSQQHYCPLPIVLLVTIIS